MLRSLLLRAALFTALIFGEYFVVKLRYDGLLHQYQGPWQHLTSVVTFAALGLTGFVLLSGRRVLAILRTAVETSPTQPRLARPLALHFASILGFFGVIHWIAVGPQHPLAYAGLVLSMIVLGLFAVLVLLPALLPIPVLRRVVSEMRGPILAGFGAGFAAFLSGWVSSFLWEPLAETTLDLTARSLTLVGADVQVDAAERAVWVEGFAITIARECSGLEGMGLMAVFVAVYLWVARARHRFPRSFLLFPVGLVAIYLANLARVVSLLLVGARVSPEVAMGGFHSKAGWVFFCLVSGALIGGGSRWGWLRAADAATTDDPAGSSHAPSDPAPMLLPLLGALALSMIVGLFLPTSFDPLYGLRTITVLAVVFWYRRDLVAAFRGPSLGGPVAGTIAFAIWIWLAPVPETATSVAIEEGLATLPNWGAAGWLALRVFGAVVTVPIAEELAFRGYLLRRFVDARYTEVPFSRVSWLGLAVSSVGFGALHNDYIAGTAVGALYGLAMWRRGSLFDAIVAHGTTNALLSGYVLWTRSFGYW
ncbi:MAG: exosortase E/protease, VPEID-CTERM system [Polyangiaceae bacterium]|nr:exosortase E/protease, VPEID-CTERM system [Polyangiaceae bacterium]